MITVTTQMIAMTTQMTTVHRNYSDDHRSYSDDHRNYSDDHNYSDDLCKYSGECCDHLDDYHNYSGDHHDDHCNYSDHLANYSEDDHPSKAISDKCTNITSDDLYGDTQYLELSSSTFLPTIEVAHPLEQDAASVTPNTVSDAGGINSQADTADLSLQSPSHKSGSTSLSFMPGSSLSFMSACRATSSPVKVPSEDSNKLIQESCKLSCK